MSATVTVVTPWKDHGELADAYLTAIAAGKPEGLVIVDNGSAEPLEFATVRFEENRGFQAACNYGLQVATSDAVLFLNNDVEMTDVGWLDAIRAELEPGVLVGANIRTDPHTVVDGLAMPYIDGWCVAGMRDDLSAIGGWDESLMEPAYYGDNLLSLRARQRGMRLVEANVGLRHLGNVTSNDCDPRWVDAVTAANRRVYEAAVREALKVAA